MLQLLSLTLLILKNGLKKYDEFLVISVGLGIIGTFLFFLSLSGFMLKAFQANKNIYFKNLNMFVLRQISSKVNTTFVSISVICLTLFLSICILSSGFGLNTNLSKITSKLSPYDATFNSNTKLNEDLIKTLENKGVNLNSYPVKYSLINIYESNISINDLVKK